MLVQINNNSKNTPDYIYLTMHGTSATSPVNARLIVYGIKDWSDNVTPEIYDHQIFEEMFEYDVGDMKMNTDLDLNNHQIKNLANGINDADAVNKHQLDAISHYLNDYVYINTFDQYYSLTETSSLKLAQNLFGVVIQGVNPELYLGTNRYINDYDRIQGLQMNNGYINLKNTVNQNTSFTFFISLYLSSNF